jgi:hypothetical protein
MPLRRERDGIQRQLADIKTALDAGREVFMLGLRMLTKPRDVYNALKNDAAKGTLTKAIFTKDLSQCRRRTARGRQSTRASRTLRRPDSRTDGRQQPTCDAWRHHQGPQLLGRSSDP